jgi:hypothetical protein
MIYILLIGQTIIFGQVFSVTAHDSIWQFKKEKKDTVPVYVKQNNRRNSKLLESQYCSKEWNNLAKAVIILGTVYQKTSERRNQGRKQ